MIVALEGIDGCGKGTQAELLKDWADRIGTPASVLSFPDYGTIAGKKLKELLREKKPDPLVLQSLMLTNRMEFQYEIAEHEDSGTLLILDRYWLSGLVYGVSDGLSEDWLEAIHAPLVQPDLWIVLDIRASLSFERRPERQDRYEADRERLHVVARLYRSQYALGVILGAPIHFVDGEKSPEDVHREIVEIIDEAL